MDSSGQPGAGAVPETAAPDRNAGAPVAASAPGAAPAGVADGWRDALIALSLALVALIAAFWGTASQMVQTASARRIARVSSARVAR